MIFRMTISHIIQFLKAYVLNTILNTQIRLYFRVYEYLVYDETLNVGTTIHLLCIITIKKNNNFRL